MNATIITLSEPRNVINLGVAINWRVGMAERHNYRNSNEYPSSEEQKFKTSGQSNTEVVASRVATTDIVTVRSRVSDASTQVDLNDLLQMGNANVSNENTSGDPRPDSDDDSVFDADDERPSRPPNRSLATSSGLGSARASSSASRVVSTGAQPRLSVPSTGVAERPAARRRLRTVNDPQDVIREVARSLVDLSVAFERRNARTVRRPRSLSVSEAVGRCLHSFAGVVSSTLALVRLAGWQFSRSIRGSLRPRSLSLASAPRSAESNSQLQRPASARSSVSQADQAGIIINFDRLRRERRSAAAASSAAASPAVPQQ